MLTYSSDTTLRLFSHAIVAPDTRKFPPPVPSNYCTLCKNNLQYVLSPAKWCYPQRCLLAISKLHSILDVANLLAHNNIRQICYWNQNSLQSAALNSSFSDNLTPLGVTFFLVAMVKLNTYKTQLYFWILHALLENQQITWHAYGKELKNFAFVKK